MYEGEGKLRESGTETINRVVKRKQKSTWRKCKGVKVIENRRVEGCKGKRVKVHAVEVERDRIEGLRMLIDSG